MICLDTAILIWGVRGIATAGQEPMIGRTRRYLDHLEEARTTIMVPTPALSEYLVGAESSVKAAEELAIFERGFYLPGFDIPSAFLAAELQRDSDKMKSIRKEFGVDRQQLRTDAMIIAIAVIHKAAKIITNDLRHFTRLAGDRIAVVEVPEILEQSKLF
jgi:predicted nucleic acid-binding protein